MLVLHLRERIYMYKSLWSSGVLQMATMDLDTGLGASSQEAYEEPR